jgi:hypothetical protein
MNEANLLQILVRGEDSRHQWRIQVMVRIDLAK